MTQLYIGGAKQIHLAELFFENDGLRLSISQSVDVGEMPSFLAFSRKHSWVVAIAEGDDELVSLRVADDGKLSVVGRQRCPGGPAYVSLDRTERFVLVGSYGGGETRSFPISAEGELSEESDCVETGKFTHCVVVNPENDFIYCPSKGSDTIARLGFRAGKFERFAPTLCEGGSGPRHLVFSPNRPHVYVSGENDCSLSVFRRDGHELSALSRTTTLPRERGEGDTGSDIHISKDGKTVYVSNRGHDSLAVYRTTDSGVELVQHIDSFGNVPRNFALFGPQWLIAANQESCSLSAYRRAGDGTLTHLGVVETPERAFWVGNRTSY